MLLLLLLLLQLKKFPGTGFFLCIAIDVIAVRRPVAVTMRHTRHRNRQRLRLVGGKDNVIDAVIDDVCLRGAADLMSH